ncbi:MAG TPA: UDP-N-acetylmuramoyl-tripeptide--D-alanyl-D-alanine ligase [Gaiellales bacterium]|nr:UDP-N-acetylmuramoyl-tripeptide--D-alanyl-D-alanine ligase [Gaiellales bacterium]
MIPLTAQEVAGVCGAETALEATVTGLAVDSRSVSAGDLFVALPGERTHGARFVEPALAAGAAAALVARDTSLTEPGPINTRVIAVPDPLIALGQVAAEVRRRSPATVFGITGSTGKTSTKDILASLLRRALPVVASHANYNTEIGLPLTLGRVEPQTRAVVLELAMRGPGQIAYLAEIGRPQVAVITNIGPVHLEVMGTIEAVAEAKAEILQSLRAEDAAVVPYDEPLLAPYLEMCRARVLTFGEHPGADVVLTGFAPGRAEFAAGGRTLTVSVNVAQHHNAQNLCAALAACVAAGLDPGELTAGGVQVEISRWRGEELELPGGGLLIADCYNANPTSMDASLRHLVEVAGNRPTVAVLGDMAELGETGPAYHDQVGALLRELGVDRVVAVGPLARAYGGTWYADREAALRGLAENLRPGDVVLVKGSRSVGLEALVEALEP